jgi:hypothetical protein
MLVSYLISGSPVIQGIHSAEPLYNQLYSIVALLICE